MTPLGQAAIALGAKRLRVFPCKWRGKEPAIKDNLRCAAIDPLIIEKWWGAEGRWNVAIATGRASGVWVLDIDGEEASRPSFGSSPSMRACRRPSKFRPAKAGISIGRGRPASRSATPSIATICLRSIGGAKADTFWHRPRSIRAGGSMRGRATASTPSPPRPNG